MTQVSDQRALHVPDVLDGATRVDSSGMAEPPNRFVETPLAVTGFATTSARVAACVSL